MTPTETVHPEHERTEITREALLESLKYSVDEVSIHLTGWRGGSTVALRDAEYWAKRVRETALMLDEIGWVGQDAIRAEDHRLSERRVSGSES